MELPEKPKVSRLTTALIARANGERGAAIIMVTHDSHVAPHTDRMFLLKDGKIIKEKQGTHLAEKRSHEQMKRNNPESVSTKEEL